MNKRTEFQCKQCGYSFDTAFMATMDYCKKCVPTVIQQLQADLDTLKKYLREHLIETCPDVTCQRDNCERCADKWLQGIISKP